MGNPLFGDYEKLINIKVLGKTFQVPEKNTCLRGFQYISPESISYGRYCWNYDCRTCRISYTTSSQPDAPARSGLACRLIAVEGMQITELSAELRYSLATEVLPPERRAGPDENDLLEGGNTPPNVCHQAWYSAKCP